ncbi:GntR family transcriptional regulator [Oceanobacillus jeddahense]|uniref:GntR family transcriptional regulator n=1 Tax=Oceanobacillus jeddahense TaxID=1462527 RepID=A0ABY5JRW7_9BACI|nr:GntR family transcriptional regulator [Oceanobacillus jeddahense]UUI03048.1 GntR family transcriptional regulator [Oceanobacillus jeddahense]
MGTKPELLLKDIAYKQIKKGILEEAYQPGTILSEKQLVESLSMSKTPIKSAIERLEAEGFVVVSSKRGIIIQDISIDRINDIYNLRIALETFNCEQIYNKITETEIKYLDDNLKAAEDYIKELNVNKFAELDHEFHLIICEIAGNKEIKNILLNYNEHLYRITLKHLNKEPERMYKFHDDHVKLLNQLRNHDRECVTSMKIHLEDSKKILFQ